MSHCLPSPTFQQTSKQKVLVTSVMEGNTILGTLMLTFTLLNLRSDKDRCRAHSAFLLLSQVKQRSSCLSASFGSAAQSHSLHLEVTASGYQLLVVVSWALSLFSFQTPFLPLLLSHWNVLSSPLIISPLTPLILSSLHTVYGFFVSIFFFFLKHMRIIFHHPNLANSGAWGN